MGTIPVSRQHAIQRCAGNARDGGSVSLVRPEVSTSTIYSSAVLPFKTGRRVTSELQDLVAEVIEGAEEAVDPLDGLVEKAASDPGAPFVPEVLERLAALKKADRAAV